MLTLDDVAEFTFNFINKFFMETDKGNFVWDCPDYPGGNNTIKPFDGSYKDWCRFEGIPYGRCKGKHTIRNYCGNEVQIFN